MASGAIIGVGVSIAALYLITLVYFVYLIKVKTSFRCRANSVFVEVGLFLYVPFMMFVYYVFFFLPLCCALLAWYLCCCNSKPTEQTSRERSRKYFFAPLELLVLVKLYRTPLNIPVEVRDIFKSDAKSELQCNDDSGSLSHIQSVLLPPPRFDPSHTYDDGDDASL